MNTQSGRASIRRARIAIVGAALLLALIHPTGSARAQTLWIKPGVGDWNVGANWSAGVPLSGTNAEINNGGTAQVFVDGAGLQGMHLGYSPGNSGTLEVSGVLAQIYLSLYVGYEGTGALTILNRGKVTSSVSYLGLAASGQGTSIVDGALSLWAITQDLNVGYDGTGTLTIRNGGRVANTNGFLGLGVGSTGTATVNGANSTWSNSNDVSVGYFGTGALSITGGGTVSNNGANIGANSGASGAASVDGPGSRWTNNGVLAVGSGGGAGTLSITRGGVVTSSLGRISRNAGSSGSVLIDGPGSRWDARFEFTMGLQGTGMSTLTVQNGGVLSAALGMTIGPLGTVRGNGTIIANIDNAGGTVAPGASPGTSPGTLHITGNYTQTIAGKLQIELASPTSFDRLDVSGNITLPLDGLAFSAVLEVSLAGGYVPQGSQTFDILDWGGSLSGEFGQFLLPRLGGTLQWDLNQLRTKGVLSVVGPANIAGDYNQNGTVDAADYVVWRNGLGTTYTQDHYNVWRANFGRTAGSGATVGLPNSGDSAVPEPASWALMFGALCLLALGRIGRRAGCGRLEFTSASALAEMNKVAIRCSVPIAARVFLFCGLFATAGSALAQTFWVPGVGRWNDSSNWSAGAPNSGTPSAEINNGGTAQISYEGPFNDGRVQNMYLGHSPGNTGTLEVSGDGRVEISNSLYVGDEGAGTLKVLNPGHVTNSISYLGFSASGQGAAIVDGAGSIWTNTRELNVGYYGAGTLNIRNGGKVSNTHGFLGLGVGSTGTATVNGASSTWSNFNDLSVGYSGRGTLSITGGGLVSNYNANIGASSGSSGTASVDGPGSRWTNNSVLAVGSSGAGMLSITRGGKVSSSLGHISRNTGSSGSVLIDGFGSRWDASLAFTMGLPGTGKSTLTVQNDGVLSAAGGMTIGPLGTVRGNGTIVGNIVNYSGIVAPGASTGTLHIAGDYTQSNGGKLQIELASPTTFDRLDIGGNISLDRSFTGGSTLQVSLADGYVPHGTQSFDILKWGGVVSGNFLSLLLPTLGETLKWDTSQLYINGRLSVTGPANLAGDYNQNGAVDAADYVVWRNGLGTTYTQHHYNIWRANFGRTAGSGATVGLPNSGDSAVPEPASWALMVGAIGVFALRSIGRRGGCGRLEFTFASALRRINKVAIRCTVRVGVPVLLSCCLFTAAGTALGQTLWVNPGLADWSTPGNWTLGVPDSASGTAFDAVIENGGIAQLLAPGGNVRRLRVGRAAGNGHLDVNGGGLTITDNFYLNEGGTDTASMTVRLGGVVTVPAAIVGYSGTGFSYLSMTGAGPITNPTTRFNATTGFIVGRAGSGALVLVDSAELTIGGGALPLQVATLAGSSGAAYIGLGNEAGVLNASAVQFGAGDGTLWFDHTNDTTFAIPISGPGSVVKVNSGVTTLAAANTYTAGNLYSLYLNAGTDIQRGTLEVTGSISHPAANLDIGAFPAQPAALVIRNGGKVANAVAHIGDGIGSIGTATVNGANSTWTNSGNLFVGYFGTGALSIAAGGKVSNYNANIGAFSGSTGAASVDGPGSVWTNNSDLAVGSDGAGTLSITGGGEVTSTSIAIVGAAAGSQGTVTVDGANSRWTNPHLDVGHRGTGALSITGGGMVSTHNANIGAHSGSSGAASVVGPGSRWINNSGLAVGNAGTGTLSIQNGGAVVVPNTSGILGIGSGFLGIGSGSHGTATVDGAGSTWTNGDDLYVGSMGAGTLNITGGGVVSNYNANIGAFSGSTGAASVDGPGSVWTNNSVLAVGSGGAGLLSITRGGAVSSTNGRIARLAGSSGSVLIDGPGSRWSASGEFTMGLSGTGTSTLSVQNGGLLSAAGGITIGPLGTLQGDGTIVADIFNEGGTVAPGTSPGTLHITGNFTQALAATLQIELASPTSFDKLAVTGNVTLAGGFIGGGALQVSLAGDYVPQGSQSFDILDWGGVLSGRFQPLLLPTLGGSLVWDTSQLYITGRLSVVGPANLAGDYNQNGTVDAADYVVWRKSLGQIGAGLAADGDSDNAITQADYNLWKQHFGEHSGSGSSFTAHAAVPEPATWGLMLSALCLLATFDFVRRN